MHEREWLLQEGGGCAVSLQQRWGGRQHGLCVQRRRHLHRRVRVRVQRLVLRGESRVERLQERLHLAEGRGLGVGGRRLLVVLQQGLRRLCRKGPQDAVRRGRGNTGARDGLGEGERERGLQLRGGGWR